MMKDHIKAYWWREVPNFGDCLAPWLLRHFTDLQVSWGSICHAQVASIGSILEHIPPLWEGFILGSGKLREDSQLHLHTKTAKVLAIRGPLSAYSVPGNYALGDPGILASELVGPQEKRWDLGIVPHWKDKELVPRFAQLVKAPHTYTVIRPFDDPISILRQIGACHRIVTSSLHGIITVDSFGNIPRRLEMCNQLAREGGDFKFRDYFESLHMPFEIGVMKEPSPFYVDELKFALYDAYRELEQMIRCEG
jgi:pyruvyltransferase